MALVEICCENENKCLKPAQGLCHHCPKQLCLEHINEHNAINLVRVHELSHAVNILTEFVSSIDTNSSLENAHNQLNRWKKENMEIIEKVYENRFNQLNNLQVDLDKRLSNFKEGLEPMIQDIKSRLSSLEKHQEASQKQVSAIESDLNQLSECVQTLQCEISIELKNIPSNDLIHLNNTFSYNSHILNNNMKIQPYQVLEIENMKEFISSKNNETILWLDIEKQLHFIDKKFQIHRLTIPELANQRKRKMNNDIIDMKWCSFAEMFLILFPRYLFTFNPKNHKFTQVSLTRYKDYPFRCICLNEKSIYLSYSTTGICIDLWKYSFDSNKNEILMNECYKHWDCLTNDKNEWVSSMNTNFNGHIGILIRTGSSIARRFEIRDENLIFLKKIQFDNDFIDRFYPFQNSYWFIKTLSGVYYIYSTETDKYTCTPFEFPYGLDEFGMNTIVIGSKQRELLFRDI